MLSTMDKLRGLYRYETAPGRWWACAETDNGQRVNLQRQAYEHQRVQPPFWELPIERREDGSNSRVA